MGTAVAIGPHTSLADLTVERDAVNSKEELKGKVCETVDAPTSFGSDQGKHFGFTVSRNERGEKVTDRQKTIYFAQSVMFKVQLFLAF